MEIGRPTEIVYSSSRHMTRTIFMVAAGVAGVLVVMAVVALLNLLRSGNLSEWIMPAAMMAVMAVFAVIAVASASLYARATESANIRRVLDGPHWAAWQYNSSEWYAYATQMRQTAEATIEKSAWGLINMIAGLGLMVLIVGGLMAWLLFGIPAETRIVMMPMMIIIPIVGFLTAIIIIVSSLSSKGQMRRMAAQSYEAMMRVSSPRVYFAADGLYREDSGYMSLRHLTDVEYMTQSTPPSIRIKSWQQHGRSMYQSEMFMPVPQGSEQAAAALIERYRRERLGK